MNDFEKMRQELIKNGKADQLKNVVNSAEGQKIGKMVDGNALKKAIAEGDKDTVNRVLAQVLSTDEGKALAKKISESFGKK
ncbi:MAG: DUF2461 domain-containing protein [Clostridiales bacterium]|nr:DUF2461 domain-containing protein [Clostridiales bacterium]